MLSLTVAAFKTPSVRDLEQSSPFFHNGHAQTLEGAIELYVSLGDAARNGARNADADIARVEITASEVAPLAAFLRSLNEDYE